MAEVRRGSTLCLLSALLAVACSGGDESASGSAPLDPAASAAERDDAATTANRSSGDEEIDLFDATQIRGDPVNQFDLAVGDCFNRVEGLRAGRKVIITSRIPCEEPHQYEVFHYTEYDAPHPAIFPGEDVLTEFGLNECYVEFENFVGQIYELSTYDIGVFIPNRDNFEHSRARYRGVTCWLFVDGAEEIAGTARDSGA